MVDIFGSIGCDLYNESRINTVAIVRIVITDTITNSL